MTALGGLALSGNLMDCGNAVCSNLATLRLMQELRHKHWLTIATVTAIANEYSIELLHTTIVLPVKLCYGSVSGYLD